MIQLFSEHKVANRLRKAVLNRDVRKRAPEKQRGETETITDKHLLKIAEKVSRNSSEEKITENFGGDFSTFGPLALKSVLLPLSLRTKEFPLVVPKIHYGLERL